MLTEIHFIGRGCLQFSHLPYETRRDLVSWLEGKNYGDTFTIVHNRKTHVLKRDNVTFITYS